MFISDSNGKPHQQLRFVLTDASDVLARYGVFYLAVDQINVDLPQGDERLMTTVHLFPTSGKQVPYTGSSIHNPQDKFSYRDGFVWAAYRAGLAYVADHSGSKLRRFRAENSQAEIERKVRAWARRVWFEIVSENGDPDEMDQRAHDMTRAVMGDAEVSDALRELYERVKDLSSKNGNEPQETIEVDLSEAISKFVGEPVNVNLDPFDPDKDQDRINEFEAKMEALKAEADKEQEMTPQKARTFLGRVLKLLSEA